VLVEELTPYVKAIFVDDNRVRRDKARKSETLRAEIVHIYYTTAEYFQRHHESVDNGRCTPILTHCVRPSSGLTAAAAARACPSVLVPELMGYLLEFLSTAQSFLTHRGATAPDDLSRVRRRRRIQARCFRTGG